MNRIILFSTLLALTNLMSCHSRQEPKSEVGQYSVTHPMVIDTSFTSDYVAEIQSHQNIEIRAKVNGYIESVKVDEGQEVKAGQLLFTIRPKEYEAELVKAKANVKTAELELQNVRKLTDKNIVSQTELDAAAAKLEEAKAEEGLAELSIGFDQQARDLSPSSHVVATCL